MIPFGFYTSSQQAIPEHDPGIDGISCPVCENPLTEEDLRTISLMEPGKGRSLFYRLHKSCALSLTDAQQVALDERVMRQAGQMGGPTACADVVAVVPSRAPGSRSEPFRRLRMRAISRARAEGIR